MKPFPGFSLGEISGSLNMKGVHLLVDGVGGGEVGVNMVNGMGAK
jgi:hypothetical protein